MSRKCHTCHALRHGPHRSRARRPPPTHPLRGRESAAPAAPCAVACISAALGDHPLRTPTGSRKCHACHALRHDPH
eukprot:2703178-Pyramimonas_sp.AAC.1